MNRRKLLGLFGLGSIAVGTAMVKAEPSTEGYPIIKGTEKMLWKSGDTRFEYRGYKVMWTGWKAHESNCDLVSQMVAFWKDNVHGLYVSNPGGWGPFQRGVTFDIGYRFPQVLTSTATPIAILDIRHEMALALQTLIDHVSDKGLQEVDGYQWWGNDPIRVHPELKTYLNWMRLPDDYRRRWREEEIREEEHKAKELLAEEIKERQERSHYVTIMKELHNNLLGIGSSKA